MCASEERGAAALNHCGVSSFTKDHSGRVCGALLDNGVAVRARCVVNATGVWAASVAGLAGPASFAVRPAKGCHVTVPFDKVRADIAAVLPVRSDRRSVFVVPAYDTAPTAGSAEQPSLIYIGTTDTEYDGPLDDVRCTPADVQYLLDAMNDWLEEPLTSADIVGTWAGLRPLLGDASNARTADLSRRHRVVDDDFGLVSIIGGKLTTYRQMAQDTVDELVRVLGIRARCRTATLRLHGAGDVMANDRMPIPLHEHLVRRHGTDASIIEALIEADPTLGQPLMDGLAYVRAEVVHAVRSEHARTLDDVLSRRTRCLLLNIEGTALAAPTVADLVAPVLGWSDDDRKRELSTFAAIVERERQATRPVGSVG